MCDDSELHNHDQTIVSVASSLPTSVDYDDRTLRAELIRLGFTPGPIQSSTRKLYLKKLQALKKEPRRKEKEVDALCSSLQRVSITKQKKSELLLYYYYLLLSSYRKRSYSSINTALE